MFFAVQRSSGSRRSIKEALVVAQGHLSLQLAEGLESDADHDEQGGTAEGQVGDTHTVDGVPDGIDDHGDTGQAAEEDGAQQSDSVEDLLDIVNGGLTGTDAGDGAAVVTQVVGYFHRIEGDHDVEVSERDDQDDLERDVGEAGVPQVVVHKLTELGVGDKARDSRQNGSDGAGEDDGHNAGHIQLQGQGEKLIRFKSDHDGAAILARFEDVETQKTVYGIMNMSQELPELFMYTFNEPNNNKSGMSWIQPGEMILIELDN